MKYIETEFEVPEHDGNWSGQWVWSLSAMPGVKEARLETIFLSGPYHLHVKATEKATRKVREFCQERGYEECS